MSRYHLQPQRNHVRALALVRPLVLELEQHGDDEDVVQQIRMGVEILSEQAGKC